MNVWFFILRGLVIKIFRFLLALATIYKWKNITCDYYLCFKYLKFLDLEAWRLKIYENKKDW